MNLGEILGALAHGMRIIEASAGHTEEQLTAMGASRELARDLHRLHTTYFGPTAYTRKQRGARTTTHDLETLRTIEGYARRLNNQLHAWHLRAELCATPPANIRHRALQLLRELRPTRDITPGIKTIRRNRGPHSIVITDTPRRIADIHSAITATARTNNTDDDSNTTEPTTLTPNAQDMLAAAHTILTRGGAGAPVLHSNVIVRLEQFAQITRGEGNDILLPTTDGGTITGAEFIQRKLHDIGYITLVHPTEGPVDLYDTSRFASNKQRIMLAAEHPKCAWFGCHKPADECQTHHIHRWQDGGATNIANLVPLCKYHNAINDDDPTKPTGRGRIHRINGRIHWQPPHGGPPIPIPSPAHPT
ncbi:HNH endonuclease signature motif containing protein [Corynebacterium sp.]|uniref:HNH endonuclease signature motif containing protein n=1 Tax=Corynebacterium sp. TaxID=1720 RepID=UPI0026DB528B|nr:HNH endonuclease signature motif containing protein [Corynebacterium sp.]MDO5033202.1 HNH endonuclease signature motif containing protein [Corynebacterium sp.]